jgi:hypothetical protein
MPARRIGQGLMTQSLTRKPQYADEIGLSPLCSAEVVIPVVHEIFGPTSVLDVGCCLGSWLKIWQKTGVEDIYGLDGEEAISDKLVIPAEKFERMDLRSPFNLGRRFSLVQSLEVAEHLPEGSAVGFIQSLTRHADVVLFSAAIPGQGGYRHLNEQWPSYWAAIFKSFHFLAADVIRPRIWNDPRILVWYRQNMLAFIHESRAAQLESHLSSLRPTFNAFNLVHPELFHWKMNNPGNWASASDFPIRKLASAMWKALPRVVKRIAGYKA